MKERLQCCESPFVKRTKREVSNAIDQLWTIYGMHVDHQEFRCAGWLLLKQLNAVIVGIAEDDHAHARHRICDEIPLIFYS